jgi:NodT family efflux transporter outer membrane factor (OMF) lipoprotein
MYPATSHPADLPRHGAWLAVSALIAALASTVVLTLSGCASSAGIAPQATEIAPEAFGLASSTPSAPAPAVAAVPAAPVPGSWWTGFGDTTLDGLVQRALAGNPTLKVARARLDRAAAGAEGARANSGVKADVTLEATRQRYTENGMVPKPLAGSIEDSGTIQARATYEFDFFGRNRAAIEAAIGNERATEADMAAARLVLASQVSRHYLQLARLFEQREVAARALSQRDEMLGLIRQRVSAGLDTQVELRQGEGALPETRQVIEALDEQIALTRHALAALTVQAPHALDGLVPRLQGLHPFVLPDTVPADLLARRPDISAARWRVEAATQDSQSTKAQFYPNVNLVAFAGLSSIGLDRLLQGSSQQYGIGPAIHLPIFDQARLRASLRGKTADVDAAVETYNGAVVDALRDVADQLSSARSIARQQDQQREASVAAESAYDLATQRYKAGLGTYLTVLNAESNVLQQRRQTADLRTRALDVQVSLARALGGGYTSDAP